MGLSLSTASLVLLFASNFFSQIHQAVTDCSFRLRCGSGDKDQPSITSANMEHYSASSVMSGIKRFDDSQPTFSGRITHVAIVFKEPKIILLVS